MIVLVRMLHDMMRNLHDRDVELRSRVEMAEQTIDRLSEGYTWLQDRVEFLEEVCDGYSR